ncbi:MAG: DUF1587 domain-containing protein [Chitinophagaceae bacterium]|nr:DUF1587 domain-containing protein [Oligoflexus sp.]
MRRFLKILPPVLARLGAAYDHAPIRPRFFVSSCGAGNSTGTGDQTTNIVEIKLDTSVFHRLNRYEYNNAIEDLLGITTRPADDFPTDPSTHGFDNVAVNLSLTPALTDQLNQASEKIAIAALKDHPRSTVAIDLVTEAGGKNGNAMGTSWSIIGSVPYAFTLKYDESLSFFLVMAGKATHAANPKSTVKVDGKVVAVYDSKGAGEPETNVFAIDLTKGDHTDISVVR